MINCSTTYTNIPTYRHGFLNYSQFTISNAGASMFDISRCLYVRDKLHDIDFNVFLLENAHGLVVHVFK